jgi:hypothetical protein
LNQRLILPSGESSTRTRCTKAASDTGKNDLNLDG